MAEGERTVTKQTKIKDHKGEKANQPVDIKAPYSLSLSQHKNEKEGVFPLHVYLS